VIQALTYGGLSAAALALGGVFAAYRPLSPRLRSHIQQAAAGFVFAAVGVEVLPDVLDRALPVAAALGFARPPNQ